jgi:hypothetical protein
MTCFGRGLAGWWEVMRGECSSYFRSGRGAAAVWTDREAKAQWGGGERVGWGGSEVATARPNFKK